MLNSFKTSTVSELCPLNLERKFCQDFCLGKIRKVRWTTRPVKLRRSQPKSFSTACSMLFLRSTKRLQSPDACTCGRQFAMHTCIGVISSKAPYRGTRELYSSSFQLKLSGHTANHMMSLIHRPFFTAPSLRCATLCMYASSLLLSSQALLHFERVVAILRPSLTSLSFLECTRPHTSLREVRDETMPDEFEASSPKRHRRTWIASSGTTGSSLIRHWFGRSGFMFRI